MNLSSYRDEALKTNTSEWDLKTHMVYGVITEIGEILDNHKKHLAYGKPFDEVNEQEELGDIWWYGAGLMADCYYPAEDRNLFSVENVLFKEVNPLDLAFAIFDSLRVYTESTHISVKHVALATMFDFLHSYAACRGYSTEQIWQANINKLRKRYGDKFTVEGAINRDSTVERQSLESDLQPNG